MDQSSLSWEEFGSLWVDRCGWFWVRQFVCLLFDHCRTSSLSPRGSKVMLGIVSFVAAQKKWRTWWQDSVISSMFSVLECFISKYWIDFLVFRNRSSGLLLSEERTASQRKGGRRRKGKCLKLSKPWSGATIVMRLSLFWISNKLSAVGVQIETSFDRLLMSIWIGVAWLSFILFKAITLGRGCRLLFPRSVILWRFWIEFKFLKSKSKWNCLYQLWSFLSFHLDFLLAWLLVWTSLLILLYKWVCCSLLRNSLSSLTLY